MWLGPSVIISESKLTGCKKLQTWLAWGHHRNVHVSVRWQMDCRVAYALSHRYLQWATGVEV